MSIIQNFSERGLIAGSTDLSELESQLSTPTTFYGGFDPTADSLHVGHLVPILAIKRLKDAGHNPLIVIGGATALIGDPSGKTSARKILTKVEVFKNSIKIGNQIKKITGDAKILNNHDWIKELSWIDMLRDIGSHFSVNKMLSMDSVSSRLQDGLSFLEFNYMILQAFDFAHLHKEFGCKLQIGGSDQWGNMVMGIELGRKLFDANLFALTLPLATKADGGKFGKTESGSIWLDSEKTPVDDFFQFWRNVSDFDVKKFLNLFTLKSVVEINELTKGTGSELNFAKEELAFSVTSLVHGVEIAELAREQARKAFSGDSEAMKVIEAKDTNILNILLEAGVESKSAGKGLMNQNGIHWNGELVKRDRILTKEDFPGVLQIGKKKFFKVVLVS